MNSSIYGYLIVFHTIVLEGSIAAAARKLNIASPSVSQSLKSLEQYMKLPLINRTTRSMELTEAGQRLFEDTHPLLDSLNLSIENVRALGETPSGIVRITISEFDYEYILRPHYLEFCQRYPEIVLEISINNGTVDILKKGFDVGVRMGHTLDSNVVARKLTKGTQLGIYASKAYLEHHGTPQNLQELSQHKLISFRFPSSKRLSKMTLYKQNGESVDIDMPLALITNSIISMTDAALDGLGIARLFNDNPNINELEPILPEYWIDFPPTYLYYLQNSQKAKRVQVFIDFLLEKHQAK
ncbi:LysR family transcriptional regulator [Pasteurellaceae bacterium Pebbles2]|nr:LysR family transcriptional regulator [Pasteurellaceae bacterium Pebbles2]